MRRDPETRIMYAARNEIEALVRFEKQELEAAITLLEWCRVSRFEIPDDEYRAVAYIRNKEYETKKGSLALLYQTKRRLDHEMPTSTKETVVDLTRYRYRVYSIVLKKGGYV